MAHEVALRVETRDITGKGAARSLRRAGKVPGVIYGHERKAEAVTIEAPALGRALIGVAAESTIFDVTVGSRAPVKALIREIQRDPVRPIDIIHIDLYEVRADETITVQVHVRLVGTADGVRNFGGVLDQALHTLEIECLPADIPDHIDVDVTNLTIGHSIHVADVKVPKATILNDAELPICSVVASRAEEATAVVEAAPPSTEPELIRKLKPEDGAEA